MENKTAEWIWYPNDYEIYLGSQTAFRRYRRNTIFPPSWRIDYPYKCVHFYKEVDLKKDETIFIKATGEVQVILTGRPYPLKMEKENSYRLPQGKYALIISVYLQNGLPALYVDGAIKSNREWLVSENMVYGLSVSAYGVKVGFAGQTDPNVLPGENLFSYDEIMPISSQEVGDKIIYDFGKETFGYVKIYGIKSDGTIELYYGESKEEALDEEYCEVFDVVKTDGNETMQLKGSRALRYLSVKAVGCTYEKLTFIYEYLPIESKGKFESSDNNLNKIYDVSTYTLHLCSREVFLDGIKRDRWPWCGDAYQTILMNFYSFFNKDLDKRTLAFLLGKEPFNMHVNHIMDYTFYWFIALYEHYMCFGDISFIEQVYPRAKKLMQFVFDTRAENGFVEHNDKTWNFVDWGNFSHEGALAVEQILFHRALTVMEQFAHILNDEMSAKIYKEEAEVLYEKIFDVFWNEEKGIFMHSLVNGTVTNEATRYANIFALLYGYVVGAKKDSIIKALKDTEMPPIVTPYAKMYELAALASVGECKYAVDTIRDYWGGMLDNGATTFWELYDPTSDDQFSMYGRKFGKSYCHAWGASPLYILGRYILGVYPVKQGYEEYVVQPNLGGIENIKGVVPITDGEIQIDISEEKIKIFADTEKKGHLIWKGEKIEIPCRKEIII